jgi:hypothetical protein
MRCELQNAAEFETNALARELSAKLQASPYLPLRSLSCVPGYNELIVTGQVPTYYLKQQLWRIALAVAPQIHVRDKVVVVPPRARIDFTPCPLVRRWAG